MRSIGMTIMELTMNVDSFMVSTLITHAKFTRNSNVR